MNKRRAILLNGKSWSAEHSKKLVNYLASYDMLIIDPHLHREIFVRLLENLKTCLVQDETVKKAYNLCAQILN